MQAESYGINQEDTLAMPVILPPLRIEIPAEEFSTKEEDNEASIHSLNTLILNFLKLTLLQIYSIHHATTIEIRIEENAFAYQAAKETKKERERKQVINCQWEDLETKAWRKASLE